MSTSKVDTSREAVEKMALHMDCYGHVGPYEASVIPAMIRQLMAERDAALSDKARLDFLESKSPDGIHVELSYRGSFSGGNLAKMATLFTKDGMYCESTIRAAIDAALSATGET